jgi:hypothetical protein
VQIFEGLGREPRSRPLPASNPFSSAAGAGDGPDSSSGKSGGGGSVGFRLTEDFLRHLCGRVLKLSPAAQVTLGVSLCQSADPLLAAESARYLRTRIGDYCASAASQVSAAAAIAASPDGKLSPPVLHALLHVLHSHEVSGRSGPAQIRRSSRATATPPTPRCH